MLLSSYKIQTVARRTQACLPATIVLLGNGNAGMAHRILYDNQVFAVIQHSGRKGSTQVVRCTFRYSGMALAHLRDMAHRLIGLTVVRQRVKTTDTGEQRPFILPSNIYNPFLQPLPGAVRGEGSCRASFVLPGYAGSSRHPSS